MLPQRKASKVSGGRTSFKSSKNISVWELYDAHLKRTCLTDSLQALKLGHSCEPAPPFHVYPTPQTTHQSLLSITYKIAILIYAVRPFQTAHTLFYQGLFD